MRVLHLVTTMGYGGIERWLLSMLTELEDGDVEMDICCRSTDVGPLAPDARTLGARVFACPLRPDHMGFARCLRRELSKGGYDLVHNHLGTYSGVATWVAGRAGVPVATTFHNTEFPPKGRMAAPVLKQGRSLYSALSVRYAVRSSTVVSGVSRAVVDSLPGLGSRVAPTATVVPERRTSRTGTCRVRCST